MNHTEKNFKTCQRLQKFRWVPGDITFPEPTLHSKIRNEVFIINDKKVIETLEIVDSFHELVRSSKAMGNNYMFLFNSSVILNSLIAAYSTYVKEKKTAEYRDLLKDYLLDSYELYEYLSDAFLTKVREGREKVSPDMICRIDSLLYKLDKKVRYCVRSKMQSKELDPLNMEEELMTSLRSLCERVETVKDLETLFGSHRNNLFVRIDRLDMQSKLSKVLENNTDISSEVFIQ